MRYGRQLLWLMLIIIGMTGCSAQNSHSNGSNPGPTPTGNNQSSSQEQSTPNPTGPDGASEQPSEQPSDPIMDQLNTLSLTEKIGQLVLVGVDGTKKDSFAQELVKSYAVGGFIFYKNNIVDPAQALSFFNDLKTANKDNKVPLFMSVDEEGGRVSRVPEPLDKVPAAIKIGATGNATLAHGIGEVLGSQLAGFGLNMDFAPVLDVNSNPNNPVIGDRAFGTTADVVSKLGIAVMKGIEDQRVIPVVKHFPGHGDTSVDSHIGLPVVQHDLERLRKLELLPFKEAIAQGADVVMIAHLLMPKLDPDYPASFSSKIIHDLLREELGFQGVVISDDMTMGAIAQNYDLDQAAVKFIQAGGNILLVGHDYDKERAVIEALTNAVKNGSITEDMLNERVYAILKLKHKYNINDHSAQGPDSKEINAKLKDLLKKYDVK
jgi:beta-N-acetylhexosaminidase